jgi:hypothetical protein
LVAVLLPHSLYATSSTTEAGIRQSLMPDVSPVIIDEAEGEGAKAKARMEGILELMRQSASNSHGSTIKGGLGNNASNFQVRSMFLLSSIGVSLDNEADASRTVILPLGRANPAKWNRFQSLLPTRGECATLVRRTMNRWPDVCGVVDQAREVVSVMTGDRRRGDVIGTLLGAAWVLSGEDHPDPWIEKIKECDLAFLSRITSTVSASIQAYAVLMAHCELMPVAGTSMRTVLSIGTMTKAVAANMDAEGVLYSVMESTLMKCGILIAGDDILLATDHPKVRSIYEKTPWAATYKSQLMYLPNARESKKKILLGGIKFGTIILPINPEEE